MRCIRAAAFLEIAAELDLEMREAMHADEFFEGLRQSVAHPMRRIDIGVSQGIRQTDGVPDDDGAQRLWRQEIRRDRGREFGVDGAEFQTERVLADGIGKGPAGGPAKASITARSTSETPKPASSGGNPRVFAQARC
jgi:hypothetical protein